jgi:anti-sigma B factor antagonist
MLNIKMDKNGDQMTVSLEGRLDTTTAPDLEKQLKSELGSTKELIFDFEKLDYISSAGLHVLLSTQKVMNKQGSMVVRKVSDSIKEIFDVTGFVDILTIED